MSDLISRQAVIDALEKVAELYPWRVPGDSDSYSSYNEAWQDALNRVENEIEALPSVQPHQIVRCKDCKYYRPRITCVGGHYNGCAAWSDNGNEIAVGPDDYCSYAERKDGD